MRVHSEDLLLGKWVSVIMMNVWLAGSASQDEAMRMVVVWGAVGIGFYVWQLFRDRNGVGHGPG